jgi:periplasmic divalent cation tolerance protein
MPVSDPQYCVVLTTTDSEQSAQAIIDVVLGRKLAACVQVLPMNSHYLWEGTIKNEKELLLLLKAKASDFGELEAAIRSVHHYHTPEVISFAVESGYKGYLDWISQVTR